MGFWESAARAGSYIANDMAKTAHRSSKNTEKFTAEQREAYSRMEDRDMQFEKVKTILEDNGIIEIKN